MVVAVILARAGSRRIPGKNLRPLGGIPLVVWTLDIARRSAVERIVTSSDHEDILRLAQGYGGLTVRRPPDMAGEGAPDGPSLLHAVEGLGLAAEDIVVHLRPTAPFREAGHIDDVVRLLWRTGVDSVVSVRPARDHPAKCYLESHEGDLLPATGRSALGEPSHILPHAWAAAGFIDACLVGALRRTKRMDGGRVSPWLVPHDRAVDLDTEADWAEAEMMAARFRAEAGLPHA